ncbi:unnamed protein product [Laminaria digitata]
MSVFMPPDRAGELQLSDAFLSFLRGCLCFETEDRMTAQDMLKHPFLQVKPADRGISLAQVGGGTAAMRDTRSETLPNGKETPPKRDEYAERVLSLTGILAGVAKFHFNNARSGRQSRTRSYSHYMPGLGPEKVPLGSNGIASNGIGGGGVAPFNGSFASTNGNNANGNVNGNGSSMASPNAVNAALAERFAGGFAGGGRAEAANSFNGESGACTPLGPVMEEPRLDEDAFQRLGEHIGVHPVVVEAVWRDEWCRIVESEAVVAQAREREFERQPSLSFREAERRQSINDTSSFSENLAVLPKMTMAMPMKVPPRLRQSKLDE